ncbi:hypothetical protein ACH40E_34250 [Streptomyces acidicola]|uniref:hypothetical protein n=1 Tax=Streptomyces acidicola TaxID=2596892 RepID=UPI0037912D5F
MERFTEWEHDVLVHRDFLVTEYVEGDPPLTRLNRASPLMRTPPGESTDRCCG